MTVADPFPPLGPQVIEFVEQHLDVVLDPFQRDFVERIYGTDGVPGAFAVTTPRRPSAPPAVARLVGQIDPPTRTEPRCSKCSGPLALATGICLTETCGHDEMGYWDDDWDLP